MKNRMVNSSWCKTKHLYLTESENQTLGDYLEKTLPMDKLTQISPWKNSEEVVPCEWFSKTFMHNIHFLLIWLLQRPKLKRYWRNKYLNIYMILATEGNVWNNQYRIFEFSPLLPILFGNNQQILNVLFIILFSLSKRISRPIWINFDHNYLTAADK